MPAMFSEPIWRSWPNCAAASTQARSPIAARCSRTARRRPWRRTDRIRWNVPVSFHASRASMPARIPEPSRSMPPSRWPTCKRQWQRAALWSRGGGTKTALSRTLPSGAAALGRAAAPDRGAERDVLELARLAGILEYDRRVRVYGAGRHAAGGHRGRAGASTASTCRSTPACRTRRDLGGTVAAGLSGAGRQRYGGLRDFLLGARFVDGQGRLVRSGGKVVKNAAGFDQHKLLIGSLGRLGVLVEVSFKVFPQPPTYGTLRVDVADAAARSLYCAALLRRALTWRRSIAHRRSHGSAGCGRSRGSGATGPAGGRAAPALATWRVAGHGQRRC